MVSLDLLSNFGGSRSGLQIGCSVTYLIGTMSRKVIRGVHWTLLLAVTLAVCPAQIPFFTPTDSLAKVISLTGQVSALKDSYPWALQLGSTIRPQQMIITGADGYAVFQVSDGSTFEVYPNSKVLFRNNPGNLKDMVDMILGRIRVHIEKIGGQPNPNTVKTPTAVISVRGTTFDVVVDEDDESTLVAVTEGQVAVRHGIIPSSPYRLVNAGEVLRVYKNQPIAQRGVDKGAIAVRIFRALEDAAITVLRSPGRGAGTPGSGGPGLPGDTRGETPPPPPPPPPPPNNN